MERKLVWKNFLLLAVGGILALHLNVTGASDTTTKSTNVSSPTPSGEECVLEVE